jgi:hypothetical protein
MIAVDDAEPERLLDLVLNRYRRYLVLLARLLTAPRPWIRS